MAAQAPYPAYIVHCRLDKRSASGIAGWRRKRLIRPTSFIVGLISAAHQALPDGGTSALSGLQSHKTLCRIRQNKHAVRMDFEIILFADVRLQARSVDLQ